MAEKLPKFDVPLPEGVDRDTRYQIANDVMEFIRKRTLTGFGVKKKKLARYSEAYIKAMKTAAFRRKYPGKRPTPVNLKLTGNMQDAIQLLKDRKERLTIGIPRSDRKNWGKAHGNENGTYGKPRQIAPKRPFLGISQKMLTEIIKKNVPDLTKMEILEALKRNGKDAKAAN